MIVYVRNPPVSLQVFEVLHQKGMIFQCNEQCPRMALGNSEYSTVYTTPSTVITHTYMYRDTKIYPVVDRMCFPVPVSQLYAKIGPAQHKHLL